MYRYPTRSTSSYSFGPGPITPVIKILIGLNFAVFFLTALVPTLTLNFGFRPADFFERFAIWQPVTYLFIHGGISHILFNMLALWMFGVELERLWGSRYFAKYYFAAGIGAAITTLIVSLSPFSVADHLYFALTIGASGAVYGVLLAYGLYFPNRPIFLYFIFPIPAKYFVIIIGMISFFSSVGGPGGNVAHTAHLGGLIAGYLYLKGGRINFLSELRYRLASWRITRTRRKFDVYSSDRPDDFNRHVH